MSRRKPAPVHPGEILQEEFLVPMGISQYRLAKDISVPARRINEVVRGQRAVTADTALRLARYFRTTKRFWLNLQTHVTTWRWRRTGSATGSIARSGPSRLGVDRQGAP